MDSLSDGFPGGDRTVPEDSTAVSSEPTQIVAKSGNFVRDEDPEEVEGEIEGDEPTKGTLDWLALQPTVDWQGLEIPSVHRIKQGETRAPEPNGKCQVVRLDGERCRATATRRYGICMAHAGGGGMFDATEMSRRGHAAQLKLRRQRQVLGIGANRVGSVRQRARLQAAARAEELATAMVDGWLDDGSLTSLARQQAALRLLDAVEPLETVSLEVALPSSADEVGSMSWAQMQQLASQLMAERGAGEVQVAAPALQQSEE